jgi:hypothetical protein
VRVTYRTGAEAAAAARGLASTVLAGSELSAEVEGGEAGVTAEIVLGNYAAPEDVEDEDEREEVLADLRALVESKLPAAAPFEASLEPPLALVKLPARLASALLAKLSATVIAGAALSCRIRGAAATVAVWDLVDPEDLEDDEEHAEVLRDVHAIAGEFGRVRAVRVPRVAGGGEEPGGVYVDFASGGEAERAMEGLGRKVVGGKRLRVELVGGEGEEEGGGGGGGRGGGGKG